jgi:hypothetical protein
MPSKWTAAYVKKLPNSAFLYVAPDGTRRFPFKDANGEVDRAKLRAGLSSLRTLKGVSSAVKTRIARKAATLVRGKPGNTGDTSSTGAARKAIQARKSGGGGKKGGGGEQLGGLSRILNDEINRAMIPEDEYMFAVAGNIEHDGSIPKQKFVKTILKVGHYEHPTDGWEFDVTPDRLEGYAKTFSQMQSNGVDVGVVKDHSFKADSSLGFITDMFVDGDELKAVHELRGHDAIALAQKLPRTSVYIDPAFKDGTGKEYGEAIVHNSIGQAPVVPGMTDEFVPIDKEHKAAIFSYAGELKFSQEGDPEGGDGSASGDSDTLSPETMKLVAEKLGVDVDDDEALKAAVKQLLDGETPTEEDFEKAVADALDALEEGGGLEDPKDLDPDTANLLAESVETIAASCVEKGALLPVVKDGLVKLLVGPEGERNGFALSARVSGSKRPLAMAIFDLLAKNDPIKLAEKTGAQVIAASRTDPDADAGSVGDITKQMVEEASSANTGFSL